MNFLQYGINQSLPDGRSALEFLNGISAVPRLAPLATSLIGADFLWHRDTNLEKLAELANTRQDSEIMTKRYLSYSENGEENKKRILIALSNEQDYKRLKDTLAVLDRTDDGKLHEAAMEQNPARLIKLIDAMSALSRQIPATQQKRRSFLDIVRELADEDNYFKFRQAYEAL